MNALSLSINIYAVHALVFYTSSWELFLDGHLFPFFFTRHKEIGIGIGLVCSLLYYSSCFVLIAGNISGMKLYCNYNSTISSFRYEPCAYNFPCKKQIFARSQLNHLHMDSENMHDEHKLLAPSSNR